MRLLFGILLLSALPVPAETPAVPSRDLTNALIHGGALEGRPPESFQWAPGGERFSFTRRPAADAPALLYVYDTATRRATPLTSNDEGPRKIAVAASRWSPKGDALVAVAGGDLYLLEAPQGAPPAEPRRLTTTQAEESDPKFSPDGLSVGFVRDHDLHVVDLATLSERALTEGGTEDLLNGQVDWVYEEELDLSSVWWWSPDSKRVAYLQFDERKVPTYPIVDWIPTHPETRWQHYPKAGDPNPVVRLGVAPAAGGVTTWIDLGADADVYVARVAWTDAGSLRVQRLDRAQTHLTLLDCRPETGACRRVLEESDPKWLNVADDSKFHKDSFLWGSERDGHRHLYLYDEAGARPARQLTRGPWDVTELSMAIEGGPVYFTATEKSPLERHLYRVNLDGTRFSRVTGEEGWHVTWVNDRGTMFIDEHSTAMVADRLTLRRMDGTLVDTLDEGLAGEMEAYRRGRVQFLTVPADDGTPLPAAMTLPPDFDPKRRYPVLVYVYGGPHAQVVRNKWGDAQGLWHQMMAARGFIVWSLDNRGMGGRGHAWETPIHRDMGRRELADQLAGVAHLKSLPYVDPARIGIWGWSYGGYMTLFALTNAPEVFRAGAAVAPVTDWHDYDTIYTERYMGRPADNERGYLDSAPLKKAEELRAPLLLVHGSSDDNVHMQNSVQILEAFVKAGRPVQFMLYPRKKHGIMGKEARTHLYESITRFFEEQLKARP